MRTSLRLVTPLIAVAALVLAACGDDNGDADDTTTTTADTNGEASGDATLDDVELVNDGQLTVCSDMPYIPFEFVEDGETQGFDYDVVSAMGDVLDVDVEFVTTPFDGIIPALVAGNCDMVASAMTITEERAEQVDFTDPYFDADQSLLIRLDDEGTYASIDDLQDGDIIGVQSGTTGADYAEENAPDGVTVRTYQTGEEIFPALLSDDVQAVLQDFPVNAYRATSQPGEFVVTESFPTGEQYGFAVSQDAGGLLDALNAALAQINDDGTYDAVFAEWFGDQD